ncbi:MAG: GNAT family N-acetyltransferase [Pseudomonadales bacterium]|nr:GNAT family N-acetyltransferase [Pseudomonadales bacterium]
MSNKPNIPGSLKEGYTHLQRVAQQQNQRLILWLSGHQAEVFKQLSELLKVRRDLRGSGFSANASINALFVSKAFASLDDALQDALNQYHVDICLHKTHLLGQQTETLIYDAFQGFDPDLFCAACGTLKAGGVLWLLSPSCETWLKQPDKDYLTALVYPHTIEKIRSRFISRIIQYLRDSSFVSHWCCDGKNWFTLAGEEMEPAELQASSAIGGIQYTNEQQQVMNAITKSLDTHLPLPIVVTADRGRGKSSAMGAAIARYSARSIKVLVSAPNAQNVQTLFTHCCSQLGISQQHKDRVLHESLEVYYVPPDELIGQPLDADLVIVDEAAAIPEFLLRKAVDKFKHIAFSTTVHGYEGTGKGFEIRFQPYLDQKKPNWQLCNLELPIRWGRNDKLETWLNNVFFLDRDFNPAIDKQQLDLNHCKLEVVTQEQLFSDSQLLEQVYSLLAQAHYRTSPGDLRDLMDGLNFKIWILTQQSCLLGCCLVAEEGGLDDDIISAIDRGIRRPRGHLIPQTLCQQMGYKEYAKYKIARIVRIAVAPSFQSSGLGSYLLANIEKVYMADNYPLIGSSFSAYPNVIHFWQRNQYLPVRMGFSKETSSGAHSLLVMKALGMDSDPIVDMSRQFSNDFHLLLSSEFRDMSGDVITAMACFLVNKNDGSLKNRERDISLVKSFIAGARTFESARPALTRLYLQSHGVLPKTQLTEQQYSEKQLEWELFIKHKTLKDLQQLGLVRGRKAAVTDLRKRFAKLDIDHDNQAADYLK